MERSKLFLLTDTMHSAKHKHFRSFPIGTEVLSFADSKAIVIKSTKCLSNLCCSLCDVQISFRSEGRNSEKKVLAVGLK